MRQFLIIAALLMTAVSAQAAGTCKSAAVDKNGKPLAGAAYNSFIKKCTSEAQAKCDAVVDKNGKPLFGAAKASATKKCMADAVG